jgi:hypothetical protein
MPKLLYRLTRIQFPDPAYFGRAALFRFDAPDRSFGVCYLGTSLDCCLRVRDAALSLAQTLEVAYT